MRRGNPWRRDAELVVGFPVWLLRTTCFKVPLFFFFFLNEIHLFRKPAQDDQTSFLLRSQNSDELGCHVKPRKRWESVSPHTASRNRLAPRTHARLESWGGWSLINRLCTPFSGAPEEARLNFSTVPTASFYQVVTGTLLIPVLCFMSLLYQ